MSDPGTLATKNGLTAVERRLRKLYANARKELTQTLRDFNLRFARQDNEMRAKLAEGTITETEYKTWLRNTVFRGKEWDAKVNHCTDILAQSNRQALNIVRGRQIDVFAENMTYQAFELEKGAGISYGFGAYSRETVGKLLKDQPELLPRKILNGVKDKAWNRDKISRIIGESIVKGDGIPDIAKKIGDQLAVQDAEAMTRYARTAMTSAQNAGRVEMLHEAEEEGIHTRKKWRATLDNRTRDAHADLDGETAGVDEPFSARFNGRTVEIMFPGDPNCDEPGMVYNCRCTLEYVVEGYENKGGYRRAYTEWDDEDGHHRKSNLVPGDMTYNEWKRMKGR